ncbi:hypothetical protein OSB04_025084 [Centaurea solstitialis]|uniref:Leucine-rich repeat-containing N-terminal plant-type domain-containing protein n=1 Tax=Centaurea solstitialis TaxID=347529 RepID=A0AA38W1C2_9ASTR|nr:hypothetical protein OSB04_025084 [Centaurea solstitialis]
MAFKNDLQYDSFDLVGWNNQTLDCCDWGGVACDQRGHVTGLDLSNKTITNGWLNASSALFGLRFLQSLNLAFNTFGSDHLPSGFGNLTQLTYLNLSNSNFQGQIPQDFSLMKNLVTLDLSSSPHYTLSLENPDLKMLIRSFTGLEELYLDYMNITMRHGYHWAEVISSSLPNLRVLSLKGCGLSGPLDSSLSKLKYLSVIILDQNTFSSDVPESFADLQNLTVLSLRACDLSGLLPKKIFQVPTLKTIDLSSNVILAGSFLEFPNNGSLENLVLSYTEIGGTLPDSIGGLPMLSRIELSGCKFSGHLPGSMQNLTRLVYLDLSSNSFTGSMPSFRMSKNLLWVNFYRNNLTGGIPSNWEGLNSLTYLSLGNNSLGGNLPESLLTLPFLQELQLSNNRLSGRISETVRVSSYQLRNLDLSSNRFQGPIPGSIFKLPALSTLKLSANNFTGSVDLDMFGELKELDSLDLSYNRLTVTVNNGNRTSSPFSSLYKLNTLKLASCKMQRLPDLKNQSRLMMLDLSDNQLSGEIPNWIWEVGNGYLRFLNLSHNEFSGLEKPYTFPFLLDVLDLHSNRLVGDIPIPPKRVYILDYSSNNFGTSIPVDFGNFITSTFSFSISDSNLVGLIPQSICNATSLLILNLHNNSLSGGIPSCLAETSKNLGVLNLGRNNLSGNVLDSFPEGCDLKTLDLSGNRLQGPLPRSLVNCKSLEVLDLGHNAITDTFPCWISSLSNLRVFVIRSNDFHGNMSCVGSSGNLTNLQIVDIALNKFSGILPPNLFASLKAIMFYNQTNLNYLHFKSGLNPSIYYQDSVTVVLKGTDRELVKILTIFTCIDFSNNGFQGSIPVAIGDLKLLNLLNFSHNALNGPIPTSIGRLANLESLDLSVNRLSGGIPTQLASLSFLSFLNLSYNELSGRIPRGSQIQTFSEATFEGNLGLCGMPLNKSCHDENAATSEVPTSPGGDGYEANELFLMGFVLIVGPLVFLRRWRRWYNKQVDRMLLLFTKGKDEETDGRADGSAPVVPTSAPICSKWSVMSTPQFVRADSEQANCNLKSLDVAIWQGGAKSKGLPLRNLYCQTIFNCQMELKISSFFLLVTFSSFLFGLLHPIPVSGQCLNDQKSLLLALKKDLKFDPSLSTKLVGWNKTLDCCQWGGVACDKAGHVTRLDISNESISGGIDGSSTLFRLTFLWSLNLAYNNFNSAHLPSGFGKLTALSDLDLSYNRFEGPIPGFIFKLPALSTLTLSANKFTGSVDLDMFGKLKELYALDLSYNHLTVTVNAKRSSAFSSLTKLNSLMLASCKMQQIPDLQNHSRLMMLDLSDNQLSGEIPNSIWKAGNGYLRFLNLSHNEFSSLQKPYTFPFLLDILDLNSNRLKGEIPIPPRRVYHLDYSNNNFGSSIPAGFGNVLTSTMFFSISNSKVVGVIPQSIHNASSLRVLDLSRNALTGPIPSIGNFKVLKSLDLSVNMLSGSIPGELANLTSLSFLNLSYNHLSGRIPQGSVFQRFTELSFKGNKGLCGPPLKKSCDNKRMSPQTSEVKY